MNKFFCLSLLSIAINAFADNPYEMHQTSAISSASGTPWNAISHQELVEKASHLTSLIDQSSRKAYPISEEDLKSVYADKKTLPFFAYSSMIDQEAGAVKAISQEAAATQELAIAFGIQRTFNRQMEAATVEKGWGALARPNDLAILNIFEKKDAVLNGVLFQLPIEDLLILTKREVGYQLIPVLAMRWEDATTGNSSPVIFVAYTFLAPEVTIEGTAYTSFHVNPIPGYFNYLQNGLNLHGEDYKAMWWATTYLADQKTLVRELPYQPTDMK